MSSINSHLLNPHSVNMPQDYQILTHFITHPIIPDIPNLHPINTYPSRTIKAESLTTVTPAAILSPYQLKTHL